VLGVPVVGPALAWIIEQVVQVVATRLVKSGIRLEVRFVNSVTDEQYQHRVIELVKLDQNPEATEEEKQRALEEARKAFDAHHSWKQPV
jgi:hypothetical protein